MALTSVITCHPVCSLEIRDFSANKIGEDPDSFVVVVLLEDLLIPGKVIFILPAGRRGRGVSAVVWCLSYKLKTNLIAHHEAYSFNV